MTITPTPFTAALAGLFSALAWPVLWSRFGGATADGSVELVVGTLLVIALPAHACVVGFGRGPRPGAPVLDTALLWRVGAWLAAAAVTTLLASALRG